MSALQQFDEAFMNAAREAIERGPSMHRTLYVRYRGAPEFYDGYPMQPGDLGMTPALAQPPPSG